MYLITKEEAMALRKKYGSDVGVTMTNRGKKSSRKTYYAEESKRVGFFLERFRNAQAVKQWK